MSGTADVNIRRVNLPLADSRLKDFNPPDHGGATFEDDDTTLYDEVTFDLTLKGRGKGHVVTAKGLIIMLKRLIKS